jgi:DNA-directed RNA polymerase specialized sigma24 family protein
MSGGEARSIWSVETSWTLINAAVGEEPDEEARREVMARYYHPVCKFFDRLEHDAGVAQEYAHGFFLKKMFNETGKGVLVGADRTRKFRPYLKTSLRHYWTDQKRADGRARKRAWSPPDTDDRGLDAFPGPELNRAEAAFDQAWVRSLLARALDQGAHELRGKGRGGVPRHLPGSLCLRWQ